MNIAGLQAHAAISAVHGIEVMPFRAARRTCLPIYASPGSLGHFHSHYAGRNREYAVPHNHHNRSERFAESGLRRQVAITHRGHRHYGPVDTGWNVREAALLPFDDIDRKSTRLNSSHSQI